MNVFTHNGLKNRRIKKLSKTLLRPMTRLKTFINSILKDGKESRSFEIHEWSWGRVNRQRNARDPSSCAILAILSLSH